MFNVRYHIASLVAVFLALALGLVLGGLVVQRGTLDGQQDALVKGLREEFDTLRTENSELDADNELLSGFVNDAASVWIEGRLEGRTVVILVNAGREDGMQAVERAVTDAGGQHATVTMLKPGFGLGEDDLRSQVASMTGGDNDLVASVTASLAAEWAGVSQNRPMTDLLVENGVISLRDLSPEATVSGLVDIASPEGQSDPAAVALAVRINELGVPVVGAEALGADSGKAAAAAEEGLAGLDGLGGEVARYSLIALLTGAEPGHYGTSTAAQAPYPPIRAPQP